MKAEFRAWDKENERMLYSNNEQNDYPFSWHLHSKGIEIMEYDGTDWYSLKDLVFMQYTGSKDKNDKEICDGDIVNYPDADIFYHDEYLNRGIVEYDEDSMAYYFTNRETVEMDDLDISTDVEVVGNIYENPELLEI